MKTKKIVVTTFEQVAKKYEYTIEVPENFNEDAHSFTLDEHQLLWELMELTEGKFIDSFNEGEEISHVNLLGNS